MKSNNLEAKSIEEVGKLFEGDPEFYNYCKKNRDKQLRNLDWFIGKLKSREKEKIAELFKDITPYLHDEITLPSESGAGGLYMNKNGKLLKYISDNPVKIPDYSKLSLGYSGGIWGDIGVGTYSAPMHYRYFETAMDLISMVGSDWRDKRYLEIGAGWTKGAHPCENHQAIAPSQPVLARMLAKEGINIVAVDPNLDPKIEKEKFGLTAIDKVYQDLDSKEVGVFDIAYGMNLGWWGRIINGEELVEQGILKDKYNTITN